MYYPKTVCQIIELLKKLPGVGKKTAERYAFKILQWKENDLNALAFALNQLASQVSCCQECGCYIEENRCYFCQNETLAPKLCIVAFGKDIYPICQTHVFKGYYHVLGGLLSPLEGTGIEDLRISNLKSRLEKRKIEEVILALDSTLNGDATALFLTKELSATGIKITKLASGLPLGCSLEFIDEGTLSQAFSGRFDLFSPSIQREI